MTRVLHLPYPPTINTYYRKWNNRMVIAPRGREFAASVAAIVKKQRRPKMELRIGISIRLSPPDKRKRDIDNVIKPLFDALTKAGVWRDDSQVDVLIVQRNDPGDAGTCDVTIWEM
jgi:crossover junction endodeoxyribonuclease RusA